MPAQERKVLQYLARASKPNTRPPCRHYRSRSQETRARHVVLNVFVGASGAEADFEGRNTLDVGLCRAALQDVPS